MKIGLISSEFPPERGGIQTYAWEYARELARQGHEVTVFTRPHEEGEMASADFRILSVLRLRRRYDRAAFAKHAAEIDVWHAMNAAYSWLALDYRAVFVTVHGNDFLWPYLPVARLDLRERLRLPFGSNFDRWLGDRLTRQLMRDTLPKASHIFTNSRYTEQRLCEEIPECRGRTSPAMVGVSPEYLQTTRPERRPGPPRLITVCRLAEQHKNVDIVLRALASIRGEWPFRYTIVGDGHLRPSLEALTRELGLTNLVTFTGFLDQPSLQDLLLASDLFILTTSATPFAYEGFGLVYLEANACGCPVLAARIGGAVEAVAEGVTGMLVDQVTPETLAAPLTRFLSGAASFDSQACVDFARRFSWESVADHCLDWYQRAPETRHA